jgi:hypothetical protein
MKCIYDYEEDPFGNASIFKPYQWTFRLLFNGDPLKTLFVTQPQLSHSCRLTSQRVHQQSSTSHNSQPQFHTLPRQNGRQSRYKPLSLHHSHRTRIPPRLRRHSPPTIAIHSRPTSSKVSHFLQFKLSNLSKLSSPISLRRMSEFMM